MRPNLFLPIVLFNRVFNDTPNQHMTADMRSVAHPQGRATREITSKEFLELLNVALSKTKLIGPVGEIQVDYSYIEPRLTKVRPDDDNHQFHWSGEIILNIRAGVRYGTLMLSPQVDNDGELSYGHTFEHDINDGYTSICITENEIHFQESAVLHQRIADHIAVFFEAINEGLR